MFNWSVMLECILCYLNYVFELVHHTVVFSCSESKHFKELRKKGQVCSSQFPLALLDLVAVVGWFHSLLLEKCKYPQIGPSLN